MFVPGFSSSPPVEQQVPHMFGVGWEFVIPTTTVWKAHQAKEGGDHDNEHLKAFIFMLGKKIKNKYLFGTLQ